MITLSNPCWNCTKRFPCCHDSCQEHKDYVAEKHREQAALKSELYKYAIIHHQTMWTQRFQKQKRGQYCD